MTLQYVQSQCYNMIPNVDIMDHLASCYVRPDDRTDDQMTVLTRTQPVFQCLVSRTTFCICILRGSTHYCAIAPRE